MPNSVPNSVPSRTCVVTYYTPNSALYARMGRAAERNRRKYCKKHGYALRVVRRERANKRECYWEKIKILKDLMDSGEYDWLFWTDVDALVTNHECTVHGVIRDATERASVQSAKAPLLIVTRDRLGLNSGNFIIRCCKWGQEYLDAVLGNAGAPSVSRSPFPEQFAMDLTLKQSARWSGRALFVPQRTFNSFPVGLLGERWQKGDFVIHFAGIPRETAAKNMERYALDITPLENKYMCLDAMWWMSILGIAVLMTTGVGPAHGLVVSVIWVLVTQTAYFMACAHV